MTVSSQNKDDFYPTPELKNLLSAAENLRREITRLGAGIDDQISYNIILKDLDNLQESLSLHYREVYGLERALVAATSRRLTGKQRMLLRWLSENYRERMVYTALIEHLSKDLNIPKSTVRWNLRGLREAGLIRAGNKENKGIPVGLTNMGRIMAGSVVPSSD